MKVVLIGPHNRSGKVLQEKIRRLLNDINVETVTADDLLPDSPTILHEIFDAIESSHLIIADLTEQNPNVLYELGIAHALRKPTILLKNYHSEASIPSDLAGTFYITYDLNNLPALESQIRHSVMSYAGQEMKKWENLAAL